jgi:uncharacterized protein YfkK (UPF0435 family)
MQHAGNLSPKKDNILCDEILATIIHKLNMVQKCLLIHTTLKKDLYNQLKYFTPLWICYNKL